MRVLYWILMIGQLVLGVLGYVQELISFQWTITANIILLGIYLSLFFGDVALTRHNEQQIERKNRRFKILDQSPIGSMQDDLKGLAWDGTRFWLTGRLADLHGLLRLNEHQETEINVTFEDGWVYGVAYAKSIITIKGARNGNYKVLEYDLDGTFLTEAVLPSEISDPSGPLIYDGKYFWLGVDVSNIVYKISRDYKIIERYNTTHRLLGAAFANNYLWLSDGHLIYQYDTQFKFKEEYHYPGVSCRGMAFDGEFMWSLDDGPKRLYKHDLS